MRAGKSVAFYSNLVGTCHWLSLQVLYFVTVQGGGWEVLHPCQATTPNCQMSNVKIDKTEVVCGLLCSWRYVTYNNYAPLPILPSTRTFIQDFIACHQKWPHLKWKWEFHDTMLIRWNYWTLKMIGPDTVPQHIRKPKKAIYHWNQFMSILIGWR